MNSTPMIDVNEVPPVGGHNYVDEGIEDAEVYGTPARTAPAGFASPARERFRLIALRLDAQLGQRAHKTLVITSPGSGDGKTTTALHLGASLARDLGKRVIVVDADLRRPRLVRPLGLEVTKGLGDVLTGQARLDDILWRVGDDPLYVVPGSPEGHGPMALRGLPPVLENLRNRADWLILDTPAISESADGPALARGADGVVLVLRSGQTKQEDLTAALDALCDAPLCGCVLNDHRGRLGTVRIVQPRRAMLPPGPRVATEDY